MSDAHEDGGGQRLRVRLEELLAEAREAGALGELAPLLREALAADAAAAPPEDPTGAAIPERFGMVGDSPAMRKVFALLEKVVGSQVPVLIQGETGTGKELVAKALHQNGARAEKPFMAENCAAVPAELLESELFGHKRGSFTGAVADRAGHFVVADGGTVFLDEIGDMPLAMQAKLLRVLQDGEIRPVGSNRSRRVDVRVIAATNQDLRTMCGQGTFREDLYFRLNVITIQLPPLRERKGDVAHLVRFFLGRFGAEMGLETRIDPEALRALERWRWPGNVRELENEVQRDLALSGGRIRLDDLSPGVRAGV